MSTPPVPTAPALHSPVGPQLTPLVAVRDPALFDQWWNEAADQADLAEDLAALTDNPDDLEIEWGLHSLMLNVIQSDPQGVTWLSLQGLRDAAHVQWVGLDLDPSYDTDGKLDGTNVAFSAHIVMPDDRGLLFVHETVYVGHPRSVLVPDASDPREAIAELVDQSLALVNDSITERDELITVRQQMSAADGADAVITGNTIRDVVNAAADEVIAVADLPATGTRDALNLMTNIVLHRLFINQSASVDEITEESYAVSLNEVLSWIDS